LELRKSDYENYDYREFWEASNRQYEDLSERIAIRKLIKNEQKGIIIDIGCGYGRLFNEYIDFDLIIMLDYSLNNLNNAKSLVEDFLSSTNKIKENKKVYFVAGDANNLPFKSEVINAAISVRVVHHLNEPQKFISEVSRILKNDSFFILEFANKRNLKNILKFLIRRIKDSPFSLEPTNVGDTIQNNHPKTITGYLKSCNFKIKSIISVSNLRISFLKKRLKLSVLILLEKLFQSLFSFMKLGPSIFVKALKTNHSKNVFIIKDDNLLKNKIFDIDFLDLLLCPNCKNQNIKLEVSYATIKCPSCHKRYLIKNGIYDLRV